MLIRQTRIWKRNNGPSNNRAVAEFSRCDEIAIILPPAGDNINAKEKC